ncbi:hypothetical protein ACVIJ6_003708 [Bradyrhizobium sp. USDA 4369]
MLSQSQATPAAACPARRGLPYLIVSGACALLTAVSLAGCQPRTVAFAGPDPADPAAHVAPARISAVIAPYTPVRPTAPAAWGEPDGARAPRSEPAR